VNLKANTAAEILKQGNIEMGKKVFLINGHQAWEISPGKSNFSLNDFDRFSSHLQQVFDQ